MTNEEIERHTLIVKARADDAAAWLAGRLGNPYCSHRALSDLDAALVSLLTLRAEALEDGGWRGHARREISLSRIERRIAAAHETLVAFAEAGQPTDGQAVQASEVSRAAFRILREIKEARNHSGLVGGLHSDLLGLAQYLALSLERAALYLRLPAGKRDG